MAAQDVQGRSLSYFRAPPSTIHYKRTINDRVRELAHQAPDKLAFVFRHPNKPRTTLTREEFLDKVTLTGMQLVSHGVKSGDTVGILLPTSVDYLIVQFGLFMAGATAVNCLSQNENGHSKMASDLGCAAIIAQSIKQSADKDPQKIILSLKNTDSCLYGPGVELMSFLQAVDAQRVTLPEVISEAKAMMYLTSGSTGAQKFVAHTHSAILLGACAIGKTLGEDAVANDRPMQWMGGYPLLYLGTGSTCIYVISQLSRFNDDAFFVDVIADEQPSFSVIMEYRLNGIINSPELLAKMPYLNQTATGGQRLTANSLQLMLKLSDEVFTIYGSTECLHFSAASYRDMDNFADGAAGVFTDGAEIKITDEKGGIFPLEEVGELCIKGDACSKEYLSLKGKITKILDEDNWYHTGDMASMSADGTVVIRGRKTEMIKRASVKIFPTVIERKLLEELGRDIQEVAVVGIPDDRLHQEVCACVILNKGSTLTQADVIKKAEDIFKPDLAPDGLGLMPGQIILMEDFPRTISSKCARSQLATCAAEIAKSRKEYESL